jgi:hypothetical protein
MNHAEQQGLFLAIVQILRENQFFSKQSIKMHFASYFYGFVVYFDASGKKESWPKHSAIQMWKTHSAYLSKEVNPSSVTMSNPTKNYRIETT